MVDAVVEPEQLSNDASTQQVLSTSYKPNLDAAARTTFGIPEAPIGEGIPEPISIPDIRDSGPAPTVADLRTPNMELEHVLNEELPSAWEAIKVGIAPTGRDWWSSYKDSRRFERDPLFNPTQLAEKFFQEHGMLSETENQYLNKAVRYEDYEYRTQHLLERRADAKLAAQRPYVAAAAGIVDIDLATILAPPVYGVSKVGTGANIAARAVQATAAGTGAALTNSALDTFSYRTEAERDMDVITFGLVGFLTDVSRVQKATSAAPTRANPLPDTPTPPQVTITPIQTGVRTDTAAPDLSGLSYQADQAPPTASVKLYHGTNAGFTTVDPTKSGGIAFFAEDVDTAARYATGAGGNRARTSLEDSYLVNEGVVYELQGAKWVAVGTPTKGMENIVTKETIQPLTRDYPTIEADGIQGLLDVSAELTPKNARIIEQDFSELKLLDLTTAEGRDIILKLTANSNFVRNLQVAAKDDRVAKDTLNTQLNNTLWTSTKVSGRYGSQIKDDFVAQLEALGYDGVRFLDDSHNSVGVFPQGLTKSVTANKTTGSGVKTQYQVPSTTTTTVMNPKGYGTLTQQRVELPKHVEEDLLKATTEVAKGLKPVSRPVGPPTEWFKKHPILGRMTASADELYNYTQGDTGTVVNKLLANVHTEGDNVASAQAAYLNNYGYALAPVEKALADAIPEMTGISSNPISRTTGKYSAATQEVADLFQDSMQKLDQAVLDYASKNNGTVLSDDGIKALADMMEIPDAMKRVLKTYVDSGFATKIYDDAATNGFFDANGLEAVVRRPTYMPLQHNYERMHNVVRDGKATWDDIYEFYGSQIARIYPELLQPNFAKAGRLYDDVKQGAKTATTKPYVLTTKQIGEHFVGTQREAARGLSDVTSSGMGKETMHDMLTRAGLSADDAAKTVKEVFEQQAQRSSNPKNLRKRMEWDWNYKMTASTGEVLDLGKLTGGSTYSNLETYSRRMAHLNGLAQYGLTEQTLKELLEGYLDKLPANVNPQRAKQFMQNIAADLAGKPTGGQVSQAVRSAQAIADPMLLANSGLFGLVDLATQVLRVGVVRSFPHIYRGLRTAIVGMKGLSKSEAKDLEDIMTGKLMQGSRWKNFITHYSDNFAVDAGIHESAQYYGQSARFMNLSESVKRVQMGMLMGTYIKALRGAGTGVAKDADFLRNKLRMPDELIDGIVEQWGKHGEKVDDWDAAVRIPMEQKIFHESDNLALTIQKGEIPAILEHDAVGKVIFPYMSYAFAINQKVLRRVWNRDGAAGVALLMATQLPIAMMVAASINVRKGEEPDKDLALGTLRAMTALGAFNYPIELLLNGVGSNGVTAMTPFSKTYNLVDDVVSGEATPRSIKQNSILNAAVFLDPLIAALED